MSAHHKQPRAALEGPGKAIQGVMPGSMGNRILLALRGAPMTQTQLHARFGCPTNVLAQLAKLDLVTRPGNGQHGRQISLTPAGRELIQNPGLSRRQTEIVYCQL